MATNDFLPFGGAAGSNVLSQSAYAALAARTAGFSAGVAKSAELNKVWRQSSIMSAALAQFISDATGQDVLDDGTIATILANLKKAMPGRLLRTTVYTLISGALNASVNGGAFAPVSATFTPLALTTAVDVEAQGGGGGSGGTTTCTSAQYSCTGGGGSGAYGRGYYTSGFSGVTVAVGAGGSAGAVSTTAGNGGTSSFGALLSAPGGIGSSGNTASNVTNFGGGGVGGAVATGGYTNSRGGYGTVGNNIGGTAGIGGVGASSVFGGGGTPQATTTGAGTAAVSYGAGAGGALTIASGAGSVGSAGAAGAVIVREYA